MPEVSAAARYEARVTVVDELVDAASGMLGVRPELQNPIGVLAAALKCEVAFRANNERAQ